ncbi:MAG: hypothetical protein NTX82_00055 [Candidatus Parcubacteria bacterium]|nr:hypothetical protein [Candidatus Parcubacteria bacterium]
MPSFERNEQFKPGFDYVQAADLARQKIEIENSNDKKLKSQVKNRIKENFGSIDTLNPEKTAATRKIFELEVDRQRLLIAKESGKQPEVVSTRQIKYDPEQQMFVFKAKGGYKVKRTAGDLISDINWGLYYDFKDLEAKPELAEFVKNYRAKIFDAQLDELEEEQLLIERIEIDKVEHHDSGIGKAYLKAYEALNKRKARRLKGENDSELPSGFVFEKMIRCLLTKLAYDLGVKWNFDVSKATVDDDIINKIDAILELTNRRRGIGVEKEPNESDLKKGYQVTLITSGSSEFRHKQDQVRKKQENFQLAKARGEKPPVDDLVLINPGEEFEDVASTLKIWNKQGMVAGGPENFLSIERSVEKYLRDIFKGTKLDFDKNPEFLDEIKQSFRDKGMKESDK